MTIHEIAMFFAPRTEKKTQRVPKAHNPPAWAPGHLYRPKTFLGHNLDN
jgi:hypothetical protein